MRTLLFALAVLVAAATASGTCPPGLMPTNGHPFNVLNYDVDSTCVNAKGQQCGLFLQFAPSALFLPPFSNNLRITSGAPATFSVPTGFENAQLAFLAFETDATGTPTQVWNVDVTFTGFQPKCNPSNQMLELRQDCYVSNGGFVNPACWQCYSAFTGTLTALTGPFAGLVLGISIKDNHTPQIGFGADGKDCQFGLSFWFTWEVLANPGNVAVPSTSNPRGDINVVLQECPQPPSIKGDPHFVGFDGVKFDFHGEPNSVFNIISDSNMQVNALFVASDKVKKTKTYLGALGVTVGTNHVYIACDRANGQHVMKFNGRDLLTNEVIPLDEEGTLMLGDDSKINIDVTNFFLKVRFSSSAHSSCHINLRAAYKSSDDGVFPHGILGQTANKDRMVGTAQEDGMNGEGAVEGLWTDYIISSGDLFGTDFKFNRFVGTSEAGVSKKRVAQSADDADCEHKQHCDHKQGGFLHGASH